MGGVLGFLWNHYHTAWVDPITCVVAAIYAAAQHFRRAARGDVKAVLSRETGLDALNGTAIFPLLLLIGSAFSEYLTSQLLHTNKVILFAAGCVALFAVLEDA